MAQLRPKIVKLAKIIGGVTGITTKIDENAPEYYCMAGILTDEEADVAIAAGLRKERTAAYLAKKVGKTVQEVQPLLDNLVYYGIFRRSKDEALGEDVYYMQIFAPGILEMMVNQKELLDTHPEVGRAFEEYTRNLAANMGAMIPDGYGLMRVIPVESALEGIPGVNEFERISHYLDKYDRFSVSPCSCRASRTSIGDGCGHLDEDMCIQMGKGAEHYIRSGRAKEITREQALEIIKRAEENGLMHDMVNIEEPGESAAICNCCACACFGLRVGLMYGARDAIRSNYVAEVDEAKCVACGQCVETCPGNALKLGQKLCSTEDLTPKPDYVKLSETLRPKRSWDPNYREDHEDVVPTGTAPCKTACPAHIPVQGYLKLAAQGRYTDALELIKKENPFPAVCGRICNKRCEAECTRGDVDEAVAIDEVKRFIADHDLHEATRYVPKLLNQIGRPYTEKIAVIGAGPAGMSCAYYLANKGYPVTVFDRNPVPGGMLTLGIPSNAVMALMIGAMMIHDITPGPQVMNTDPELFWGLIVSMWIGNLILIVLNLPMIGVWVQLLRVPYRWLYPAILAFCCIGVYSINNNVFDVWMTIGFGAMGYLFNKLGCESAPLILGFILGPMMEENMRRALLLSRGNMSCFLTSPLSAAFLALSVLLLLLVLAPAVRSGRETAFRED